MKKCTKCDNPVKALGLCSSHHYQQWIAKGNNRERKNKKNKEYMKMYSHPLSGTEELKSQNRISRKEYRKRDYVKKAERIRASTYNKRRQKTQKLLEKKREYSRNYVRRNLEAMNARTAFRRASKLQATPPWLTPEQKAEIKEWYTLAKELRWLSEEPLHVDHIIPVKGKNVCGLHVPWNLQILPRSLNISKGNKL